MGSRLERAFITAKSFLEEDLSRKEAAEIIGRSRSWTYGAYEDISQVLEEDIEKIEDKGHKRVVREIQEWFAKGDRKNRFRKRIQKEGSSRCIICGRFYSKNHSSDEVCKECSEWLEKQTEFSI